MKQLSFALLLLLVWSPLEARAEGPLSGGTRIYVDAEQVGPFDVTSFAAPNPPITTDNLWVSVQVRDGARAVTDARVWVTVTARDSGKQARTEATHELAATELDYTAVFPVAEPGLYDVAIEVEHVDGAGETTYAVTVSEPLTQYIFLLMGLPFLLLAVALGRRFGRAS